MSGFVSIHAPARGATRRRKGADGRRDVSIHAPARGATAPASPTTEVIFGFQFTRPRGARRLTFEPSCKPLSFQFTRPRGARPRRARRSARWALVSIHAPARGATGTPLTKKSLRFCFNSRAREGRDETSQREGAGYDPFQFTRPRGARRVLSCPVRRSRRFQFTRPRGARRRTIVPCPAVTSVSIHAPARGAT